MFVRTEEKGVERIGVVENKKIESMSVSQRLVGFDDVLDGGRFKELRSGPIPLLANVRMV